MRILLNIISIVIMLVAASVVYFNMQLYVDISGFCPIAKGIITVHAPFSAVVITIFCLGFLSATVWSFASAMPLNKKLKEYQRKLEKTTVLTDAESSKVAVLEAKIETLEKALDSALNDK